MKIVKFRPSSHSEDGTIVATFETAEQARRAAKSFRQAMATSQNRLILSFCNEDWGTMSEIVEKLEAFSTLEVKEYLSYQELIIEIELPRRITRKTMPLLLPPNLMLIINWLMENCEYHVEHTETTQKMKFEYRGEQIYCTPDNASVDTDEFRIQGEEFEVDPTIIKIKPVIDC